MMNQRNIYIKLIKRLIGFLGAILAILITSPVWIVTIIVLYFANKNGLKGIFFTQDRPGKDGKIFKVIKFKTMTDERDAEGNLLPDEVRLTKVGRFVRSTSIDELPQLINVLKGDMSFIGPRPLYVNFLKLYDETQARRHEVRPGISGWAQVHGRNLCTYSKKFEYDVWYVDNISFKVDIQILFLTIKNVLCREDIGVGSGNNDEVDDLGFTQRLIEMGLREE